MGDSHKYERRWEQKGSNVMDPPLQHGFYEPEWFQG
jgi:hypothetical protein